MTPYGGGCYRAVEVKVDGVPFRPGGADYVWLVSGKYFICFIALTYNRAWHAAPIPSQGEGRWREEEESEVKKSGSSLQAHLQIGGQNPPAGRTKGKVAMVAAVTRSVKYRYMPSSPRKGICIFWTFWSIFGFFFLVLWVCVCVCFFVCILNLACRWFYIMFNHKLLI